MVFSPQNLGSFSAEFLASEEKFPSWEASPQKQETVSSEAWKVSPEKLRKLILRSFYQSSGKAFIRQLIFKCLCIFFPETWKAFPQSWECICSESWKAFLQKLGQFHLSSLKTSNTFSEDRKSFLQNLGKLINRSLKGFLILLKRFENFSS